MGEPSVDSEGGTPIPHQRFIPQWGKHSIGPICSVPAIRPSRRTAPVPLCAMLLQAGMLEKSLCCLPGAVVPGRLVWHLQRGTCDTIKESLMNFDDVYQGKTVCVTGHTGFKGSWLCEWLLLLGANVVGYS